MENAAARMVRGKEPIRHHVRRKVRRGVMVNQASNTKFPTVLMRRVDFSTTSWVFNVCRFFLPE
jgi:hypothetical protein